MCALCVLEPLQKVYHFSTSRPIHKICLSSRSRNRSCKRWCVECGIEVVSRNRSVSGGWGGGGGGMCVWSRDLFILKTR